MIKGVVLDFYLQFDLLELDRLNCELLPCPLLLDACSYIPDTVDLTEDTAAREYWLKCLSQTVEKVKMLN